MATLQQAQGGKGCAVPVLTGEVGFKVSEDNVGDWEQVKNKIFPHFFLV